MICDESPRRDTGQECRTNATGVPAPKPGYFTNPRLRRAIGPHLLRCPRSPSSTYCQVRLRAAPVARLVSTALSSRLAEIVVQHPGSFFLRVFIRLQTRPGTTALHRQRRILVAPFTPSPPAALALRAPASPDAPRTLRTAPG